MATGRGGDTFAARRLAVALPGLLRQVTMDPPLEIGFDVDGELTLVRVDENGPTAAARPGTVLSATPGVIIGLAAGALTPAQALAAGHLHGDPAAFHRLFPG